MIVPREPPYPPPPRHAPADLGRRPLASPPARALGLAAHLLGIALFVLAPALFALAAAYALVLAEWPTFLRALGFIVFATTALVHLPSFLPRRLPPPPGVIPVSPDDQPTPYAFVARVAEDLGAKPPRRLLVGSGTELGLGGRRSLLDLARPGRWDLTVGLWLWHGLTLSEFQAVVARTLAPLARWPLERVRFAARAVLASLIAGDSFLEEMADTDAPLAGLARLASRLHLAATWPLRPVARVLHRLGVNPPDALADDLAAVRLGGSDAMVHAVLRADFAGATLKELDDALERAAARGVFARDLYAHTADAVTATREAHNDFTLGETPTLRGPNAGKYADVYEPGQHYLSDMWRRLPGPVEREQNAKRTFVPCERDDRPAADLLDGPGHLRERLTALRYQEVLDADDDYLPLSPEVVGRWLRTGGEPAIPERYGGVYDPPRLIDPGGPAERDRALATDAWEDARLASTAAGLYARAGERAARWRAARAALDKILRRTMYRPAGRDRAMAEDLEDDQRKVGRWLSALDRWAYVVHVHMAARLPDLALHDALIRRYESVLDFQSLAADAREYRNRVAAYVRRLEEYPGPPPYRLGRDARREFEASRKDFSLLMDEAADRTDPLLTEWTGGVSLDRFLHAHTGKPFRGRLAPLALGLRLLRAWEEVAAKARWLHLLGVTALLELHREIEERFAAQAGPAGVVPEAIVLEPVEEEVELEPDVVEEE